MVTTLIPDSCLVEVAVLSNIAQVFGLLDSVKKILETRRQQTDPSQEQILCTLSSEYRTKNQMKICIPEVTWCGCGLQQGGLNRVF